VIFTQALTLNYAGMAVSFDRNAEINDVKAKLQDTDSRTKQNVAICAPLLEREELRVYSIPDQQAH
jgi:hypothetical protein